MTNSLSQDIVAVGQLMADNLNTMGVDDADVDDGLTTLAGKILNVVTEKIDTILEIDIDSLNLVYDDDFNITGVLTDENDDAVSSASVKLLIGSTVVDTQTTDSNGEVTFTYCPVSTGTHTFKLVYEGDNTYDNCASSTVTRTVDKETAYIAVGGPSVVGMYSDGEYSVSGSLMDNDSPPEPVKNKQINVYESNNLITSFTTGSDGAFSGSISGSTLGGVGEHILSFEFAGDDNYTSSTSQKKVVVASTYLSLVSSKDKLSYADGDSCTLTATYTGAVLEGRTVVFKAYKNGVLVETIGSDDTDSSGVAIVSYSSKGAGDLSIRAECMNLQETYSIEDCLRYDDASTDMTSNYSYDNLSSLTFSTDHYEAYRSLGASDTSKYYSPIYADDTLPSDFEMSVMCKSNIMNEDQQGFTIASNHPQTYSGATELGIIWNSGRRGLFHRVNGSSTWYTDSGNLSNNTWYKFILKVQGTSVTATIKDSSDNTVYTSTQTISSAQSYKKWNLTVGGYSKTLSFKDLKIKPL